MCVCAPLTFFAELQLTIAKADGRGGVNAILLYVDTMLIEMKYIERKDTLIFHLY